MAKYDNLPIYKRALELTVYVIGGQKHLAPGIFVKIAVCIFRLAAHPKIAGGDQDDVGVVVIARVVINYIIIQIAWGGVVVCLSSASAAGAAG